MYMKVLFKKLSSRGILDVIKEYQVTAGNGMTVTPEIIARKIDPEQNSDSVHSLALTIFLFMWSCEVRNASGTG